MRISGRLGIPALYLTGVAGAVGLLWHRFNGVPSEGPLTSDLLNNYVPVTRMVADRLAAGELPLWNVHACNGIPLLATAQVGAFYPGILLSVWLPGMDGLHLLMLSQCVLAGCFMAGALRAGQHGWLAAAVGGVAFSTACVIGASFWPPQVSTITWLPWIWLCVEKFSRSGGGGWWLGIVAGTALALLGGFPQYLVYGLLLLGAVAVARVLDERALCAAPWRSSFASLALMAGGVALGAAIAAIQLLPTLELAALSARSVALPSDEISYLQLGTPGALAYLGHALDPAAKPLMLDYGRGGGYLTILIAMLVPVGVVAARHSRVTWTLLGVGLAALLLSDGPASRVPGIAGLYELLPGASLFRSPERLRLIYLMAAIALAVSGLDAVLRASTPDRERWLLGSVALVAAALVCVVGSPEVRVRAALGVALLALALFARRPGLARYFVQAGLALFVVTDLFLATARFGLYRDFPDTLSEHLHTAAGLRVSPERVAAETRDLGWGRVQLLGLLPWTPGGPVGSLLRAACYEPLAPDPWPNLKAFLGQSPVRGQFNAFSRDALPGFYDAAGISVLFEVRRGRLVVERNGRALPRAYLAAGYQVMNRSEIFDALRSPEHPFRRLVALERSPGYPPPQQPFRIAPADIASYEPEEVRIRIQPTRRSLLVLSDTWYPGWIADVDGEERPILRANGMFRAVAVAPGDREVSFRYRPRSLRVGAAVSIAGALLSFAIAATLALRSRRSRPAE